MFRILIWDYAGQSLGWRKTFLKEDEVEVVHTITREEPVPEILLQKDSWDWLLIFERGMRGTFNTIIKTLNLPSERIIYPLGTDSWPQHPKAIYTLLNDTGIKAVYPHFAFKVCREQNDFVACTAEGLNYVATSRDDGVMRFMYTSRINFAANELKRFYELSEKYYNVDISGGGYFLDLGANIGTSSIYFVKKFAPNLKILAFEPAAETFKLLRMNLIFNDVEAQAVAVNCGVGEKTEELEMHHRFSNDPGANSFVQFQEGTPFEIVKIIAVDQYLSENKIEANEVKYLWIDVEGFEPQVILGAKNLIKENPVPIFAEFSLGSWRRSGRFEDMMSLLAEHYSHFIHIFAGKEVLYPLEALYEMKPANNLAGVMGDIFLIKKGAIEQ